MPAIDSDFIGKLTARIGSARVLGPDRLGSMDPGCHADNLAAEIALAPTTTAEVSTLLALCDQAGVPVVPQGGRTGLSGGSIPRSDAVILMLDRLNQTIDIDAGAGVATVDAGVTLHALDAAAAEFDLSAGIDIASRGSATIGGMVSTNAGGGEAFRNGIMRQRVVGLEAVLADGTVLSDLKKVTKANEGLDVKQLFIGAEGTLGVVTRCALQLAERDGQRTTVLAGCDTAAAAGRLFSRLRKASPLTLLSAEIMWRGYARTAAQDLGLDQVIGFADCPVYVLFDVSMRDAGGSSQDPVAEILMAAMEAGELLDAVIAKNQHESAEMWRLREDSWAIDRQYPGGLWYDISVPRSRLDDYVSELVPKVQAVHPDLKVFAMGHLGDGNLHLTISSGRPAAEHYESVATAVYDGLSAMGGSFSAEHGIGEEKRTALHRLCDPGKLKIMKALKRALDPNGIMNPGKILAAD